MNAMGEDKGQDVIVQVHRQPSVWAIWGAECLDCRRDGKVGGTGLVCVLEGEHPARGVCISGFQEHQEASVARQRK